MKTMSKRFKTLLASGLILLLSLIAISHTGAQPCVQPPSSLVSWYPGDGNANDIESGNNGTLANGAAFDSGLVGQAFHFTASLNSGVRIPSNASLNPTDAITLDAWVFPFSFPNGAPSILRREGDAGSTQYLIAVGDGDITGVAHCNIGDFAGGTGGVVVLNQWTHVACTYDRQFVRLYVNGVEVAAQAATQPIPAVSHELWIGNHERFIRQFDGLIDEVEIFHRALSEAEIQAIVNAGSAGKCKEELASLGLATLWIGLKNSDDQGTQFDLRTEVYINDTLVADGETRCITGVTRNPTKAKEVSIEFGPISDGGFGSGDELSLRVLTRIGTNPDDTKCSGPGGSHNNAVGLRLYYDAVSRPSRVGAQLTSDPDVTNFFLHSEGPNFFLDDTSSTAMSTKFKDSAAVNFAGGNPWKEIGTWSMPLP